MAETVVRGTLKTPKDNDGNRKSVMLYTTPEAVVDPVTKVPLNETLENMKYTNATETSSGLMSSGDKMKVNAMDMERIVISETEPTVPCTWFEVLGVEE